MLDTEDVRRLDEGLSANIRALIRALGMAAKNDYWKRMTGGAVFYGEDDFLRIIEEEGIGHNSVISRSMRG